MRIGIQLGPSSPQQTGGLAVLLRKLVQHLGRLFPEHEYLLYGSEAQQAYSWPGRLVCFPEVHFAENSDRQAAADGVDVLLKGFPLFSSLPLSKQVFLIPDMLHEDHPEFFTPEVLRVRRLHFNQALTGAGAIATISEFSRQRILAQPNLLCSDIVLVPPGVDEDLPPHPQSLSAAVAEERGAMPYFLFPANCWPHKNHRRVLEAFAMFRQRLGQPCRLVCTGDLESWRAARLPASPFVEHLGYVSPERMRELLRGAVGLVFFSLYEGFGMPVLEAFAAGTPVLCSNTTSLPEVVGNAALVCDPTNVHEMSLGMLRALRDPCLRHKLVRRGRERLRHFSWETSARTLEATLRRVAERLPSIRVEEPPLVTIVTPSFNQGQFLRRTIDSVLEQDYPNIEYVVMDGGSSDDSVAILRSYGERLHWMSGRDGGQTDAINTGFTRSRGSLRAYLNSDDVLLPGAVARAVEHFLRHPDWDLLYGRAQVIDENDQVLEDYPTDEYSFGRLVQDCCICQPAAFWRTRMAQRVGPLDARLQYAMDYEYWMRIDRAGGQLRHVADYLAASRRHSATKTLSARREVYREIFEVSLRHAGYAGPGHYLGYWHHLCRERDEGWPRHLAKFPALVRLLARVHSRWHRSQSRLVPFCRDSAVGVGRKVIGRLVGPEKPTN